jgi:hypothetical protein
MLELYAFMTLMSMGYVLSRRKDTDSRSTPLKLHKNEIPSVNTPYDANYYHRVREVESNKASRHHARSRNPKRTGVIHGIYRDTLPNPNIKTVRSELADVEMNVKDFSHNNMTPFFGSRVKQNLSATANRSILENFTGSRDPSMQMRKKEISPMFKPNGDLANVYGTSFNTDKHIDRFAPSRVRNNEKPFESIYVGPGLNKDGYGSQPYGGFHQIENEFMRPKTVDDLRVLTNPKETYEGRIVQGAGIAQRGQHGSMYKNRQSLFEERNGERLFITAAGNEVARKLPDYVDIRETERETTTEYLFGDAVGIGHARPPIQGQIKDSIKQQLEDFGFRNVEAEKDGMAEEFDHGRENFHLPEQERDLTVEKTYEGNLTGLVKAIVAPLEDVMKLSRKQITAAHPRSFGELQSTAPPMATIKDPNDVARTTIKETNIHDAREGNIRGPTKLTVYDPEDIMRTTTRQTTDDVDHPNLKGHVRESQRDPNASARTTIKETTLDGGNLGAMSGDARGAYKTTRVDMPMTQKEYLSDNDYVGIAIATDDKRPTSHDNYMNAEMNELREGTLRGRAPTYTGAKEGVEQSAQGDMITKKLAESESQYAANVEKVTSTPLDSSYMNFTKSRDDLSTCADSRLDGTVLASLKTNPYAMPSLANLV